MPDLGDLRPPNKHNLIFIWQSYIHPPSFRNVEPTISEKIDGRTDRKTPTHTDIAIYDAHTDIAIYDAHLNDNTFQFESGSKFYWCFCMLLFVST